MASSVKPANHLSSLRIPEIVAMPVGEKLQDTIPFDGMAFLIFKQKNSLIWDSIETPSFSMEEIRSMLVMALKMKM